MKVLFLVLTLSAVGCAHSPYKQVAGMVSQNGLSKYYDKQTKIMCYVYENSDAPSLSCLPFQEGTDQP